MAFFEAGVLKQKVTPDSPPVTTISKFLEFPATSPKAGVTLIVRLLNFDVEIIRMFIVLLSVN